MFHSCWSSIFALDSRTARALINGISVRSMTAVCSLPGIGAMFTHWIARCARLPNISLSAMRVPSLIITGSFLMLTTPSCTKLYVL